MPPSAAESTAVVAELTTAVSELLTTELQELRVGVREDFKQELWAWLWEDHLRSDRDRKATAGSQAGPPPQGACPSSGSATSLVIRRAQRLLTNASDSGSEPPPSGSPMPRGGLGSDSPPDPCHSWTRRHRRAPTWNQPVVKKQAGLDETLREALKWTSADSSPSLQDPEATGKESVTRPASACTDPRGGAPSHIWTKRHRRAPTKMKTVFFDASDGEVQLKEQFSGVLPGSVVHHHLERADGSDAVAAVNQGILGKPADPRHLVASESTHSERSGLSELGLEVLHAEGEGQPLPKWRATVEYTLWGVKDQMTRSSTKNLENGLVSAPTCRCSDWSGFKRQLRRMVGHSGFESFFCLLIFMNSIFIGAQTDFEARGVKVPTFFVFVERAFTMLFVAELLLRIFAYRQRFFCMKGWMWNVFDTAVIISQVGDEVTTALQVWGEGDWASGSFSLLRILRLMRLIRVLRMARVLKRISELRTLVVSIMSSMRSLAWTMVLFVVMIYILSLYLTQVVAEIRMGLKKKAAEGALSSTRAINAEALDSHYGSLGDTMFSLFMAITGGVDWEELCVPLMEETSPLFALFFSAYVAFAVLAMLNVVTGVFVESVLKSQAADRDLYMVNNARELFEGLEGGIHAGMTWATFDAKLNAPQMLEFFKAIEVDPSDAQGLFQLLDMDGSGEVSAEEFLSGALRLRGPSKALDVALLIQEVREIRRKLEGYARL